VTVNNPLNANGVQDGNFADANGGWAQNDSWEFTMDDTGLSDSAISRATSMKMNLRYYISPGAGATDEFRLDVWDGAGWTPLETFNVGNPWQAADPGDYIEDYDISGLLTDATKLNAAKFRLIFIAAAPFTGIVYVDSIRIVTDYTPPAGQKAFHFGFTSIYRPR